MPDIKISAGADPVTLLATDKTPVARSGSTTAYAATMTELAAFANTAYVPNYSTTTPPMDGSAFAGSAAFVSRGDHVHPTDTTRAPLASPTFTGDPKAPTPAPGDNDTSIATTAFVLNAVTGGTAAAIPGASYCDNGGFAVNQRTYVSGTALAAAAFGHDRWKGGAAGCTYTFTQSGNPATTVTITAGTLQQVVEGAALVGGTYTLSWTGTAQGRIGAGSYAASPVTATVTASTNTTIEFNIGTVGRVKFEVGSTATPWVANSPSVDLANCQRFYQAASFNSQGYATAGAGFVVTQPLPVRMRALPAITTSGVTQVNCTGSLSGAVDYVLPSAAATATGMVIYAGAYTVSADL